MDIETLIKELGLDELPEDEKLELHDRISTTLLQTIIIRVTELMDDSDALEFGRLIESEEDENLVFDFIKEKVPEFQEIAKEEVERFKNDSSDLLHNLFEK